jgi:phosphatidylglycerol:prolipoprotein diacylglycerol transferase
MFSFTIEQSNGMHALFYLGSYVLMFVYLLQAGARRKYPVYPFVLVLLCTCLFALIGGKLFSYSPAEWREIIQNLSFPPSTEKRLFGYMIFGFLGLILSRKILHFKEGIFDLLAVAGCIRLILARLGCLFGGCCFGLPTHTQWGIRYAGSFPAFQFHQHSGWIPGDAEYSLFVHPTQLYEVMLGITILVILHLTSKKGIFRKNLSFLLLAVVLYGAGRFTIEFLRIRNTLYLGLNSVQWLIVALVIVSALSLWISEKKRPVQAVKSVSKIHCGISNLLLGLGLGIAVLILIPWLSPLEVIISYIILFFLAVGTLLQLTRLNAHIHHFRLSSLSILISLVFMGQTPDTTLENATANKNHVILGIGGLTGSEEDICGGSVPYQAIGAEAGYGWTDRRDYKHSVSTEVYKITYDEVPYWGFAPYYEFSSGRLGFGAGFNYSPYRSFVKESDLYPKLYLRLGRQDKFFIDSRFSNHFPGGIPAFQAGIGFGFGNSGDNFYQLRLGISEGGVYLSPTFNLQNRAIIDPFFVYGDKDSYQAGLRLYFLIH